MKVVIAGGSGLVGTALTRSLLKRGDEVVILSRNPAAVGEGRGVAWGASASAWTSELRDADAVVNLAGAGIADKRWTDARKRKIRESRVNATRALVDAMLASPDVARAFVSASAIGYYAIGSGGELDESAPPDDSFLSRVSVEWEREALRASEVARVVILRIGVVVALEGGALGKMLLPFRMGVGGKLGSGNQWMSWIHIDDLVAMIEWSIASAGARGAYNATAPSPVTNAEFTRTLGTALRRPTFFSVPGFALEAVLGEMAKPLLLTGERIVPARAMREGFQFARPALGPAIDHLLNP